MQAKALVTKGRCKVKSLTMVSGTRVSHIKFGRGVVKNIMDGGRDYEVTVDFERIWCEKNVCLFCKIKAYLILFVSRDVCVSETLKNI